MAHVTVDSETETGHGWSYRVRIERDSGDATDHAVTLAWVDHEHWTGGITPPSRVVEALARLLAQHEGEGDVPAPLPARFDASTARRWRAEIERELENAM